MENNCRKLHQWLDCLPVFKFPFDEEKIPLNGIYVLFERGEKAHQVKRIVRVGTHTGSNQLRSRLRQHFIAENKDRSIFRKNIGRCLLNRTGDPFLEKWELDLTSSEAKKKFSRLIDFKKQNEIEKRVTRYIQDSFSFVVLPVDNKKERLCLEAKIISTVSLCKNCRPSENWLGLFSPKKKIRESGLWLVNELYKEPLSYQELKELMKSR